MAAYSFNSEPRVVSTRSEKYKPEERMTMNLMNDKRVFRGHVHDIHNIRPVLSPQEQEELHLKKEKDKKQEEMLKKQLEGFKKNKNKQSPYDIRPAATGRIEVDLQYFLTDQKDVKPYDTDIPVQTDEFLPKPPDLPYVPKKTGRDVCTQIEDGDLFSFNIEVQPILNVLTSKTLEQALLEVEEESEIDSMHTYKAENQARKVEEEKAWGHMVKEEAERVQKKNLEVQAARAQYVKTLNLVEKFQNLNIAKSYLEGLVPKILDELNQAILQANDFENVLKSHYLPFLLEGTEDYLNRKNSITEDLKKTARDVAVEMKENREKIVKQHKQKSRKELIRSINFEDTKRLFRFLYINPNYYVQSEFTMRIGYTLRGEDYPENMNDSVLLKDVEKKEGEEVSVIEDAKEIKDSKPEWAKYLTLLVGDLKKIGFAVANHPIQATPKELRKYSISAELFDEEGQLIHCSDSSTEAFSGVFFDSNCRDLTKKSSNDEMIIISLKKLPETVSSIVLYVNTIKPSAAEFKYAKYQLTDFSTSQKVDSRPIKTEDFAADENGLVAPLYLAYRIYRQERNPRNLKVIMKDDNPIVEMPEGNKHWIIEVYNLPISKTFDETRCMVKQLLADGFNYNQKLTEGLINYRTMKLLQEIEYKKQLDENDQPGSKKKKKRPAKGKTIEEPVKMTEYIPPPPVYPSRSFGPILVDVKANDLQYLMSEIENKLDAELTKSWELGYEFCVKNKPINKIEWILKAQNMKDLTIRMKLPEEPAILNLDKEELDS